MGLAPPIRLLRLANPLVRAILRSPVHGLLSRRMLVLSYRGRQTGRTFAIPLRYVETADGRLVALAVRPERKLWWRAFREQAPALLLLRGERMPVSGAVVHGQERASMLEYYNKGRERLARATRGATVVVFEPRR